MSFSRQVNAFLAGLLLSASCVALADEIRIEDFEDLEHRFSLSTGDEFPGARGQLIRARSEEGGGCATLIGDFSGGGAYVAMSADFHDPVQLTALRFQFRCEGLRKLGVRLTDSTGQVHQQFLQIPAGAGWHQLRLTRFTGGDGEMHWGGANDGLWHDPATSVSLIVEKGQLSDQASRATVWIDDVVAEGKAIAPLRLDFVAKRLGNIFIEGEEVTLGLETNAPDVHWRVRDWRGAEIIHDVARVEDGEVLLSPKLPGRGYFAVEATVAGEDRQRLVKATSLAVLAPVDLSVIKESPFGVCTHFAQGWNVKVIPLIAKAGIKEVRDELYWELVEESKGNYTLPPSYQAYLADLRKHHLAPLIPLTFESTHYDQGQTPYSDDGLSAYARYGEAVLQRIPEIQSVEIWNEYNGSFCKGPATENRSVTYSKMLAASYPVFKKVRPGIRIAGAATAGIPWPYLEKMFHSGALDSLDVVSIHPYRYRQPPEGMEDEIRELSALIRRHHGGKGKPIWATEYGWGTLAAESEGELEITELDQAKFLVRGHALLLAGGAEKAFWYLFQDTAEFPGMGLIHGGEHPKGAHTPKPAYVAYAALTRELDGVRFVERELAGPGIYSLRFVDAKERVVRILWAVRKATLELTVPGDRVIALTDLMGATRPLAPGRHELELNDAPVYLRGSVEGLPIPGAVHEAVSAPVIADSAAGFSAEQGKNDWSYGYEVEGEFVRLNQYRVTDWTREWIQNDIPWLSIQATYQHPSAREGKPVAAVRRWISREAGPVTVAVDANLEDHQGDGIGVRVRHDGRVIFDGRLGGGEPIHLTHTEALTLRQGSHLDFIVDPGPSTDYNFDGTTLRMRVTAGTR